MKNLKKVSCLLLAFSLMLGLLAVPSVSAQAAAQKASVPKKIRISKGNHYNSIDITYANSGDKIKNIKTNSKNLVAKQTSHSEATGSYSNYASYKEASIGLYAKKDGTYTVKFDIYSKDGKTKRSSHNVKVYVKSDPAIKSIKFAGKALPWSLYTTKKSGKLSIKMAKGYSLKKIEVITYDKSGKEITKTVKNNKTISLSKNPSRHSYSDSYTSDYDPDYNYSYSSWYKSMFGENEIKITYKDKWTKETQTTYYSIYRTK